MTGIMKTTKADFELFCREAEKWIEIFGLKDWEVKFNHLKGNGQDYAVCSTNPDGRTAKIELYKTWPEPDIKKTENEIKTSAFHEVCHIFLETLVSCARARFIMSHELEEAGHGIIRTLEKVLYPKYEKA